MASNFTRVSTLMLCLGLAASFAQADSIIGDGVFSNTELSDANPEVMSTITITDSGFIKNISVTINDIQHTNTGDLIAELRFLGPGGPSGPGGLPAYLFFRPNVDAIDTVGSRGNLNGNYTFTDDPTDNDFWLESAIPDDQDVPSQEPYFASDMFGIYHDIGGPDFFDGFNARGDWQLIITDANTGINENNDGTVQGWTIEFHVIPIPEPGGAVIMPLMALVLSRRRRL